LNESVQSRDAFGALQGEELERLGRFGGILLVVGALVSLPAGLVLEPAPPAGDHLIGLATLVTGIAALLAPWQRMSANWLHLGLIVATIEIAAAVAALSDDFAFFYVLVAMYAAYAIRDARALAGYALLLTVALLAPLIYADGDRNEQVHHILVTLPVLVIAGLIVRVLRDTLERREREYRSLAVEAVALAERIRGRPAPADDGDLDARLGRLEETERRSRRGG
jgi:hypothetical protein